MEVGLDHEKYFSFINIKSYQMEAKEINEIEKK